MNVPPWTMMLMLAALSLLPFAALIVTSFSKVAVVLSLVRTGLGTQQAPPTLVLTGIALVLSAHVMAPVLARMADIGQSTIRESLSTRQLVDGALAMAQPLREFLVKHGSSQERERFASYARELRPPEQAGVVSEEDFFIVLPAFVITELKEAFQMGFMVLLPFLVMDLVVANVLMALGMQMLSPATVSLVFKILLFVSVDGWSLLARGLILGYRS